MQKDKVVRGRVHFRRPQPVNGKNSRESFQDTKRTVTIDSEDTSEGFKKPLPAVAAAAVAAVVIAAAAVADGVADRRVDWLTVGAAGSLAATS